MSAMEFENVPVLVGRMAGIGKLPSWAKDLVQLTLIYDILLAISKIVEELRPKELK